MSVALALSLLLCGCTLHLAPARSRGNAKPVTVYGKGQEPAATPAEAAPVPDRPSAEPAPAETSMKPETTAVEAQPAPDPAGDKTEITAEYLISRLESKDSRTPAEEDAYRRLLGVMPQPEPRAEDTDVYSLLGRSRDSVLKGDYESARRNTSEAMVQLRRKTDPAIDAVYFATEVLNYGNADKVSSPEFRAGQKVLLVTDLSSFACEPVGAASPPELYRTRMSQRIAVYDSDGKLAFEKSFEAHEYQSSYNVTTMFIPRILQLPANMKPGSYTVKVEIVDELAGRQNDAGANFTVR
jgi:hypothetical protein